MFWKEGFLCPQHLHFLFFLYQPHHNKGNWSGKRVLFFFNFSSQFKDIVHHGRKVKGLRNWSPCWHHTHNQEAESDGRLYSDLCLFILCLGSLPKEWCHLQWMTFPTPINLIKIIHHRHIQSFAYFPRESKSQVENL